MKRFALGFLAISLLYTPLALAQATTVPPPAPQREAITQQSTQEVNAGIQKMYDATTQGINKIVNAIPNSPFKGATTTKPGISPQQQTMATYKDLLLKLNAEASKVPGYTTQVAALTTTLSNIGMCRMGGVDGKACIEKYRPEITNTTKAMLKIIKDSINAGNVGLKNAYDNLNSFAKQNGMQAFE